MRTPIRLSVFAVLCLFVAGCATTTAGKFEQAHQAGFETVDVFLRYELDHRDDLPAQVTQVADDLRVEGPPLFIASWDAIQAYKADPDYTSESAVRRYLVLIRDMAERAADGYAEGRTIVAGS